MTSPPAFSGTVTFDFVPIRSIVSRSRMPSGSSLMLAKQISSPLRSRSRHQGKWSASGMSVGGGTSSCLDQ